MGLVWDDDVVRIDLPDGEWVEVKSGISKADRNYCLKRAMKAKTIWRPGEDERGIESELDFTEFNLALLERMIVAWSYTDKQGKPVPVKGNIERLDEATFDFIVAKIDAMSAPRTEDEKNRT